MRIRRAQPHDLEVIVELICELAAYEKSIEMAVATPRQLNESLFAEHPSVFCDVVEADDGEVAGFAVWFLNYSTWTGTNGIYLEDLFVRPVYRGHGLGKALMIHLAKECADKGYHRLQWWVLDWNEPSIDFYRSLGAEAMDEWTVFRVSGEALERLATRP